MTDAADVQVLASAAAVPIPTDEMEGVGAQLDALHRARDLVDGWLAVGDSPR